MSDFVSAYLYGLKRDVSRLFNLYIIMPEIEENLERSLA